MIICGDALAELRKLPDESVNMCVTSPPYWGLRDYGTAKWEGGNPECIHVVGGQVNQTKDKGYGRGEIFTSGQRPGIDASVCRKCRAVRIDSQLGLERTPEEYVAKMVEVFREVRRVLRKDGTLWLNLGDSYAGGGRGDGAGDCKQKTNTGSLGFPPQKAPHGFKPKDLCMIPARVAMALQEPYYTGTIRKESDRRWLAAMVDGEGCIFVSRSKAGAITGRDRKYFRTQDAFDVGVKITNTNRTLIDEVARLAGHGSVRVGRTRDQDAWEWATYSGNARRFIREIYPALIAKQHEARLALGCPASGDEASAAHEALKGLHHGIQTTVDFPAPASMFEPGFYLRQDVIWSKPNPMPESVRDRCTKAHEYIFLLSKSSSYFYDADAVKEPSITDDPRRPYGSQGAWDMDGRPAAQRHGGKVRSPAGWKTGPGSHGSIHENGREQKVSYTDQVFATRNLRSVWTIATRPYAEAHFATFPPEIPERCIKAGCPKGGTVLDPFFGAGTTGLVAIRLGREFIGIELSEKYCEMARKRIYGTLMGPE